MGSLTRRLRKDLRPRAALDLETRPIVKRVGDGFITYDTSAGSITVLEGDPSVERLLADSTLRIRGTDAELRPLQLAALHEARERRVGFTAAFEVGRLNHYVLEVVHRRMSRYLSLAPDFRDTSRAWYLTARSGFSANP